MGVVDSRLTGGSFVRRQKVTFGVTLLTALRQRYGVVAGGGVDTDQMYVVGNGQRTAVEVVGASTVNERQR